MTVLALPKLGFIPAFPAFFLNSIDLFLPFIPAIIFPRFGTVEYANLKGRQKQIFEVSHINTCALRASYKVALRVAKAKKPYTIGETLVIGCIQDVCMEMLGEPAAKKVAQVPLSNDTIARRIHDLAHDMEDQLIGQIKNLLYQ